MKKWFRFFCLSFFSDKISREAAKRGYTNVFWGLILAFAFIWAALVGADMLPFSARYGNSPNFQATAHAVLANPDIDKRIDAKIENGVLKARKQDGEYTESLLVNTFESSADKESYSVNGYNIVVDLRPADTLAEVEAYCVSNDGKGIRVSYGEYLTLSEVARLNFDFKLEYTGRELVLSDEAVAGYRAYVETLSDECRLEAEKLANDLSDSSITKSEYNRAIYQLYFTNYYPDITAYESSSKVPLLRNYYYHRYVSQGVKQYLFIFDDYLTGSFEAKGGAEVSFYGFYSDLESGTLVAQNATRGEANAAVDRFIKDSYMATGALNLYAHAMNVFTLIPFIALMPMVVTLLAYSLLKLRGIESVTSLGGTFKIIGSYVWFSAFIAAALTVIASFFVRTDIITALPQVLFFITLAVRSVIFAIRESKSYLKQQETVQTED